MSGSRDKVDTELNHLISRLNTVREKIGGPVKESVDQVLGEDGLVDRFQELRLQVATRLDDLKALQTDIAEMKSSNNRDSRDRIQLESDNRKMISNTETELKEMEDMHKIETKKKRSKYTKGDLEIRASEVGSLRQKLDDCKDFARRGFVGNREAQQKVFVDMKDSELFKPDNGKSNEQRGPKEAITEQQSQRMIQIQNKDKEIDAGLENVGRGLDMLKDLAIQANQEVKTQAILLDGLGDKMEGVQDHILDINDKLKETLEQVRSSDKLCCDILCILCMVGMIYVLYKVSSNASESENAAAA